MTDIESHTRRKNFEIGHNLRRYGNNGSLQKTNNFLIVSETKRESEVCNNSPAFYSPNLREECGTSRRKPHQFDSIRINAPEGSRALHIVSGDALIEGTLCVKKLNVFDGGSVLTEGKSSLAVSLNLNCKKVRFVVPTRIAEFTMPQIAEETRFSAFLTSRDASPLFWRLFDKSLQLEIVQGRENEAIEFVLEIGNGGERVYEVHIWKTGLNANNAVAESLRIDYV